MYIRNRIGFALEVEPAKYLQSANHNSITVQDKRMVMSEIDDITKIRPKNAV